MIPQFAERFWDEVERQLVEAHGLSTSSAQTWVKKYRRQLSKHHVGDAVYNRGEDVAVSSILDAMKHGEFLEPATTGK